MERAADMDRAQHVPVLAGRVTALLSPALAAEGAVLVDATLGRAGHARALLQACPGLFLVGIDADVAAIEAAGQLLAPYAARVTLVHARYDEIPAILSLEGSAQVMGLLFDLGVSSPQLDDPARGFAYAQDAPLDMRMDQTAERTAADIVNGYPPAELARILHEYGEERFARRRVPSSSFTSIRRAWKVRLAGFPPVRLVAAGIASLTIVLSRSVEVIGARARSRTTASAIRRANRSSPYSCRIRASSAGG